jgi:hypothetical protein
MGGKPHVFWVGHQFKQRLILRALNEMNTSCETENESAAITEMIVELETLISRRQRGYTFEAKCFEANQLTETSENEQSR